MYSIIYNKPVFNLNIFKDTAFFKVSKNGKEYNALVDSIAEDEIMFLVSDDETDNEISVTPSEIESEYADIVPVIIDEDNGEPDISEVKSILSKLYTEYTNVSLRLSISEDKNQHNERMFAFKGLCESLLSAINKKEIPEESEDAQYVVVEEEDDATDDAVFG